MTKKPCSYLLLHGRSQARTCVHLHLQVVFSTVRNRRSTMASFENSCHCTHVRCFIVAMYEQTLKLQYNFWRPSESTFVTKALRFTRKTLLFEVSQASPFRPSSKRCVYLKKSTEHCWNGNDGGNPNYRDETSS